MSDSTFLSMYKASLYPVPLDPEKQDSICPHHRNKLPSLLDLACEKIVLDSGVTLRSLDVVPVSVYYNLMLAALALGRDRAIEVLVSRWPWRVLSLARLAPPLFGSVRALYDEAYVKEHMRRGIKFTTCLAHTFVECLKKRTATKLQYLDLTGYPTAEVIVNYLSSHVLLVSNEIHQKKIISMYNEVAQHLPDNQRNNYEFDTTIPDNTYIVSLDACIQSQDMEFCRALKTSSDNACQFRLQPQRLDLSCVGMARICVMLEQVNPQHLSALCLKFNALHNDVLPVLVPAITPFTRLTCLDLGCNDLRVTLCAEAAATLAGMLKSLPALERLDLSNNAMRGRIEVLLSGLQRPLKFLRLCACLLSPDDLAYLADSHHANEGLEEIDLSENGLSSCYGSVSQLLTAVAPRVAVLELENCRLLETQLEELFETTLPTLQSLRYLNVCRNKALSGTLLMSQAATLAATPVLTAVKLSYPLECYLLEGGDVDAAMDRFQSVVSAMLHSLAQKFDKLPVELVMECS